ncbi:hypothetical protein WA026_023094 [Henosepilachna vigintioctopunctata]|uniref:Uncharacterized protein n=1 Tax=Henosepilachna vigintioctopunctata TaxID=420089 RepID=A0AAW1U6M2_9CUCU
MMSISEDEFDSGSIQEPRITMSKAELRKTHKPIMEKRRRARINHCLNEIKSLVLEALNKDPSRHSKLEKADILEMAVKHLQSIQRQQLAIAMATDPTVVRKFKAGFNDCAEELDKCLNQIEGVGNSVKQGLSSHLRKCITGIEQVAHLNFPDQSKMPFLGNTNVLGLAYNQESIDSSSVGDPNNNPYFRIPQGLQLVPERLRPGELTLLLSNVTNSNNIVNATSNHTHIKERQRPSAFATVIPSALSSKLLSPPLSPKGFSINDDRSSPLGFRPVQSTKSFSLSNEDEPQVCQISSTSASLCGVPEIKSMKYPIQSFQDKKALPNKANLIEPLCVITNRGERYKQAQVKDDSAFCEENVQRGVKRKFLEMHQGLLSIAQDYSVPEKKLLTVKAESSSTSRQQPPSPSVQHNEEVPTEMWRPW